MSETPSLPDTDRPPVPDIVIPRGVTPFSLRERPVRGRVVRLGPLSDALLGQHDHPAAVAGLIGQALALTAALSTALKHRGSFSFQARGDGPIGLLLADCTGGGALRGYARTDLERLNATLIGDPSPDAGALLGRGLLAFTIDPGQNAERYQGIVALDGPTLADMAMRYFQDSVQLPCLIRLACRRTDRGWRAAAFMVEKIASSGAFAVIPDDEPWQGAAILASTLTDTELLDDDLPPETLLHRLFHAEGLIVHRPRPLSFGCRCSRARLTFILESMPSEDLDHMAIDGDITMNCEFCNHGFRFARASLRGAGTRH